MNAFRIYNRRSDTYLGPHGTWSFGEEFAKLFETLEEALKESKGYVGDNHHCFEVVDVGDDVGY